MRAPIIFLILILSVAAVYGSFSSDFDYRKAADIISAEAGGIEFDEFLMSYYMNNFQKGDCASTTCTAKESAEEKDCKCRDLAKGEMCFDIFIKSTASETNPELFPSEAEDYCLDDRTLMEGFVNCVWLDQAYWLEIDCPEGFICRDGSCTHELNTTIGPVFNIFIDDNGTIVSAEYITINGTIIRFLKNATLGPDDSILSADSLVIDDILYEKIINLQLIDSGLIGLSYAELPYLILGGLQIEKGYSISIINESTTIIEGSVNNVENKDVFRVLLRNGSFMVVSPIDNSTMLFKGDSDVLIGYDGKNLEFSAEELDVTVGYNITYSQALENILDMDMPDSAKIELISGLDELEYLSIIEILDLDMPDSEKLELFLEFNIPDPPFIKIIGEDSYFRVKKEGGLLYYYVRDATFYFDGANFKEIIDAKEGSEIIVSLQSGIYCVNLSNKASYRYIDLREYLRSYDIRNDYQDYYMFCTRKKGYDIGLPRDGYVDMVSGTCNLTSRVVYGKPDSQDLHDLGHFSPVYDSYDENTALMELEGESIRTMRLSNNNPISNTFSYMSYFVVLEDNNRYAYVKNKKHDYIREYSTSGSDATILVEGDTLVQTGNMNVVTVFGPDTEKLFAYERFLSDLYRIT